MVMAAREAGGLGCVGHEFEKIGSLRWLWVEEKRWVRQI
jgi:hypothetical protein